MDKLTTVEGKAYPFGMKNVDTDIVIPAHWLKTISRNGLGRGAFEVLRKDPGNVFDDPAYAGSPILIAGDNFGCGSSREHAAWALADMGIKVVIAPSFSDIFSGNAFKNGILTVVLPQKAIDRLMEVAQGPDPYRSGAADRHDPVPGQIRVRDRRLSQALPAGRTRRNRADPG
jgi:3-isopropylmalate dehydratase/3-isopropylmalate/(R)-2-methylmalate dehydratase small subunit